MNTIMSSKKNLGEQETVNQFNNFASELEHAKTITNVKGYYYFQYFFDNILSQKITDFASRLEMNKSFSKESKPVLSIAFNPYPVDIQVLCFIDGVKYYFDSNESFMAFKSYLTNFVTDYHLGHVTTYECESMKNMNYFIAYFNTPLEELRNSYLMEQQRFEYYSDNLIEDIQEESNVKVQKNALIRTMQ